MNMNKKDSFFPVYKNDGYSILSLNSSQRNGVNSLVSKLNSGEYNFQDNPCQCGNNSSQDDILVSEKDMFGIPNRNILCSNCGLIRSEKILVDSDLSKYYDEDYKPINYNLSQVSGESYYKSQMYRGKQFYDLLKKNYSIKGDELVYDMGCGSGGVMHYFNEAGMACKGNDYSKEYLEYGNSVGMNLSYGDMNDDGVENNSVDIFVLSHVYEHLVNTQEYLKRIFSKIKVGGVLIMEVPGVFAEISEKTGYPLSGCQFAHVINFYHKDFLKSMFEHFGLKVVFGNERCTFIVEKTNTSNFEIPFNYQNSKEFIRVSNHLQTTTKNYRSVTNKVFIKRKISALIRGKII